MVCMDALSKTTTSILLSAGVQAYGYSRPSTTDTGPPVSPFGETNLRAPDPELHGTGPCTGQNGLMPVAPRPLTQRLQVSRWPLPPTPIRQFHCQFHFCQLLSAIAANAPAHLLLLSFLNRPKKGPLCEYRRRFGSSNCRAWQALRIVRHPRR